MLSPMPSQPFLVAEMGNESAAITILDTGVLPNLDHIPDSLFRRGRLLEVRRVLLEPLHHPAEAGALLRGDYIRTERRCSD